MNAAALTGGIASGKSAAAAFLKAQGVSVFDTDHAAAQLTVSGGRAIPALRAAFGPDCLDESGALDRARMRERVFADAAQKQKLEAILHPLIRADVETFLADSSGRRSVVMIPLFFETMTYRGRFREVVCIDCPTAAQLSRLVQVRGLDESMARAIVASQIPRAVRLQLADRVLANNGSLDALEQQVRVWLDDWA